MSYCIDTTNEESFAEGAFAEKFSYISSSSHVVFAELIDSLSKHTPRIYSGGLVKQQTETPTEIRYSIIFAL